MTITNKKFENEAGKRNPRYGYGNCSRCMQPTMILDFGQSIMFCTNCTIKHPIPKKMADDHFMKLKLRR